MAMVMMLRLRQLSCLIRSFRPGLWMEVNKCKPGEPRGPKPETAGTLHSPNGKVCETLPHCAEYTPFRRHLHGGHFNQHGPFNK
eukprot:scaffold304115_cov14-Prasinocladus_malaysianus.AAC.1